MSLNGLGVNLWRKYSKEGTNCFLHDYGMIAAHFKFLMFLVGDDLVYRETGACESIESKGHRLVLSLLLTFVFRRVDGSVRSVLLPKYHKIACFH